MLSILVAILSLLVIPNNSFKNELDGYLKKNLPQYESIDYQILQMPESYKKIEIIKDRDFNFSGNLVYVPVRIIEKNGRVLRSIISVKLSLYEKVLTAVKSIDKDDSLTASDFALKKMDITKILGSPLTSLTGIELYRSKTFLKPGDAITKENIELKPVINPGDRVEAEYRTGSVSISFEAFSRQEGIPGETISIITRDKKLFKARVVNSQIVNIIE
ncbi:MAG: flagellar basal body P-ring formation chaperone FlgA [Bacteroidetes bacterium]|nr:flagellar basal body P-ring formation chaperone FlgA [Bacteroidota bacterium]